MSDTIVRILTIFMYKAVINCTINTENTNNKRIKRFNVRVFFFFA